MAKEVDSEKVIGDILQDYPAKVARKRAKHIVENDPQEVPEVQANIRTVPGITTQRGCCYAGCKGVVLGPVIDIVHIVHGPIGCSYYAWATRRNLGRAEEDTQNFLTYAFSTDMQEDDIVFGGENKLRQAVREAYELFHPKAIAIFSTCPVGLIGDDVHAVAREMREELGDVNVFGFSCEGYKGVSQSAGHHIANNGLFQHVIGLDDTPPEGKYNINILGEYNIGGDAWEVHRVLEKCGINVVGVFSGDVTYGEMANAHTVDLNCVMCHRSINYMADMMETKFGIPWIKVNFIGAESTAKSVRKIAQYFGDQELIDKVEEVLAEEMAKIEEVLAEVKPKLEGKLAMLFVGGSRAHHYQMLFADLGMKVKAAGYEFAHRDDYEGRRVIPTIKVDADNQNIEEIHVDKDPERYKPRKTEEEIEKLELEGLKVGEYEGMMPDMETGTLVIDDISHHEMERLIETYKPAIFCSGIKDKYVIEKMGVPCKQLHNYDYGGPFAGFEGAINFYKEMDRMINNNVWSMITPPWDTEPSLRADYAHTAK